jgi:hypothetical protein
MRKISAFAYRHFVVAQILITISHVLLLCLAMQLAGLLDSFNIFLSPQILVISLSLFVLIAFAFKTNKNYYRKRFKYFSYGLILFVCICCFYSNDSNVRYNTYFTAGGTFTNPVERTVSKAQHRKEWRKAFKEIKSEIKASKGNTGKTFAIIGVVLGALALLAIVAVLSCSLACNGSGALALLVALAGSFGVVLLMTRIIKKINNKKPETEVKEKVD